MKCYKQPTFLQNRPTPITDIWEVRLSKRIWYALVQLAKRREITFSTLTRYCIFRLIEKENLHMNPEWRKIHHTNQATLKNEVGFHRHLVCFYGEDVTLLRIAAIQMRLTVSAIIRLAIALYMPSVAMEKHNRRSVTSDELFQFGIKRWLCIQSSALNKFGLPVIRQHTFSMFLPWQWWS